MNEFQKSIQKKIGVQRYERISGVLIGIIGCGGLGSNAAVCLARSGFERFILMDFDRVDYSNLNRQYFFYDEVGRFKTEALRDRLLRINADIKTDVLTERLDRRNIDKFKNADAIVEAVDIAETKAEIAIFGAAHGIFTVSSSGMAGYGDGMNMSVRKIGGIYVTGDFTSEVSAHSLPYAPKVAIAAALEADIVLAHFMEL